MALTKERKKEVIEDVKEKLDRQKSMIFVDFSGLSSDKIFELKGKLEKAGCVFQVVKKSLFKIALRKAKISISKKIDEISGQLALIFCFEKENKSPKISYQFSEQNKNLEILGGYLDQEFKLAEDVIAIAKLPTREELLAGLTNIVSAPTSNFVGVLKSNLQKLVIALKQIKN